MTWIDPTSITTAGAADGNGIYDGSGSLSGPTLVTGGANTLDFTTTVADGFSVNGTTFSVDGANDRIGIGTTTPLTKLQVKGGALIGDTYQTPAPSGINTAMNDGQFILGGSHNAGFNTGTD